MGWGRPIPFWRPQGKAVLLACQLTPNPLRLYSRPYRGYIRLCALSPFATVFQRARRDAVWLEVARR
jgi:hypothetical protein